MADIFISYARSSAPHARTAAESFRTAGYSVWLDEDLPSHRAYADVISEELEAARAVLVIWSADASNSEWVRSEADRARAARKLIQCKVEAVSLPMPFDQIQCADLAGWRGEDGASGWRKILASVTALAPREPHAHSPESVALPDEASAPVLAVLPFDNLSADPSMQSLSDGVSEEIIGSLGRGAELKVIGRSASFRYRGDEKRHAAQALKATHLLDGSVRSAGARVRIAAELTKASTGEVVWSDRYDRQADDIFALQDEIAEKVAEALRRSLGRPAPLAKAPGAALAEPASAEPERPESENRQVTVLFAEIDGLSELAHALDETSAQELKRRVLEIFAEGVEAFEGFVEKLQLGRLEALFGAPAAQEDHAQRACFAALHLQDRIARLTAELRRQHDIELSARMGVNSGQVVVGLVTHEAKSAYTAEGRPVTLARRLQAIAQPDCCYVSAATAALVEGYVTLEDVGASPAGGQSGEDRVYRLAGLGAARTRLDVSRARGLSQFVGRAGDLDLLKGALDHVRARRGQVIGVVAEAGTGKSRLCFEFLQHCRAEGMQVYEARAVAHGRNIPFLPVLELLRAYLGVTDADDAAQVRERVESRALALDPALAPALPLLFDFLGAPDPARLPPPQSPGARQSQIIQTVRHLIYRMGEVQPIVTMIEDLHWLDAASAEFLEQVIDARGARSLLLLNFRPEFEAPWMANKWYRQIPLGPLDEPAVAEMLRELLGDDGSVAALTGPLFERTGGNPFFIEEVIQSLVETGRLQGPRGSRRLVTPADQLEAPSTIQAVVAARIDRLSRRDKRLLQVAAVIGKDFSQPLLAKVAGLAEDELTSALMALQSSEFIVETSIWPTAAYAFRHPLTHEIALGSQVMERRRRIHASVADALEAEQAERLDEAAALIATHWSEAGDARRAALWWLRAARHTLSRFATGQALAQTERGIAETSRLPEDPDRWQTELELRVLAGNALLVTQGNGADATAEAFTRALELCEKLPASPHRIVVEYGVVSHIMHRLEMARALEVVEGQIALGIREANAAWRFVGLRSRALLNFYFGRFSAAVEDTVQCLEEWREGQRECGAFLAHDPGTIGPLCYGSYDLTFLGRLAEAQEWVASASAAAAESGHHMIVAQAIFTEGVYLYNTGDWDAARPMMERVLALATEHDLAYFKCIASAYLGTLLGRVGEADRGLELVESAVSFQRTTGSRSFMPNYLARQGELMSLVGRPHEAIDVFAESLRLVEESGARWDESAIRARRASALEALGDAQGAEAELRKAYDVTVSQGARLCQLHMATLLGHTLASSGRRSEGEALVREAIDAFPVEGVDPPHLQRARAFLAA